MKGKSQRSEATEKLTAKSLSAMLMAEKQSCNFII